MKILIQNGRVVDPASGRDERANVAIAAGRIIAIGAVASDFAPNRTIDASSCIVAPGLVDLSVRLREPGQEHARMLESEMAAAVAGGVTSLVCPPNTEPVLDEPGLVDMLKFRAEKLHLARVFPLGALTRGLKGEVLTDMAELTESGCIGFGQAENPIVNTQVLQRALQYAATFGYTVWLHPLDAWLGKGTAARVHICRISSAAGLALVRQAKAEGLPVSCDVSVHNLHLTDVDMGFYDSRFRLQPPLRQQRDRDALRQGLADGTIDALVSDHNPVDSDAKTLPFAEAEPGATAVELLLGLACRWAEQDGLPMSQALRVVTAGAQSVLGQTLGTLQDSVGRLSVGGQADICVFHPDAPWTVQPSALRSQGKHTPFEGHTMSAAVRATLVGGHVAFEAPSA